MILFFMGCPTHSGIARQLEVTATELHQQGTFNAKTGVSNSGRT
jgi:hypothetical protein